MKGSGRLALAAAAATFIALTMLQSAHAETVVKGYIVESNKNQLKLTLEQATKWAQENSYLLKTANQNVDRNAIMLRSAADELKQATRRDNHEDDDDSGPGDAEAERAALKRYEAAASTYEEAKKQIPLVMDQLEFQTMKAYYEAITAADNVTSSKESLELALQEEKIALAKAARGKISGNAKGKAVQARMDAERKLAESEAASQKVVDNLSKLMGRMQGTVYELVDIPTYSKPKALDIELHIHDLTSSGSPALYKQENAVKQAMTEASYYNGTAISEYQLKALDVEAANMELAHTKQQLAESLKAAYLSIQQYQAQYEELQRNLQIARDEQALSENKWRRGLIPGIEVKTNEIKVKQLERKVTELAIQQKQTEFTLFKPWLM
ncbi:TolC family protein [Paenibacillus donghaensis]|uniref:TolC family protein n=1 Tax=Paenibacillus donghaensis TaxID=414771 RepID=UPI0018848468|nr:TolC family protein [Paenibacillus donghaensis]MBE9915447.1 TolC family protein [Paenibacillus donghaensis]